MSPEQIKQLRTELQCTARELAQALGVEPSEVQAWENGERFATKRRIKQLENLRARGAKSLQHGPEQTTDDNSSGMIRLADPEFWRVVRKLAAYPQLFEQVVAMTESFEDPVPSSAPR